MTALVTSLGLAVLPGCASAALPSATVSADAPQLHVSGNELLDSHGTQVILHGVDRSGTEFMCVQGLGIFHGPSGQASIMAMKRWHINAVRVPLNEACWNGQPYVRRNFAGLNYQRAIENYVKRLNSNGIVAILDLHWTNGKYTGPASGCASARAVCQKPMPDVNAIKFWTSVANSFKGNDSVIFDLFNEPYPEIASGADETTGWSCWLHGGVACVGISYPVAGMQSIVNAIRSTGAHNVIMIGGLAWANDLSQWLAHEPVDPDHNLVASWHSRNFNACSTVACWNSQIAPVIARVPVIVGEIGENDCRDTYLMHLMAWLDSHSTSYLAWAWDVAKGSCRGGSDLIANYDGSPTPYGTGYKSHLSSIAQR